MRDLEAFIAGRGANDALLYGPPGTGKSATVRALASVFADRGLRLVQVDRADIPQSQRDLVRNYFTDLGK
jgi:predicted AAA+ superfamily ATPase